MEIDKLNVGSVPLSPDFLNKAKVGIWVLELEDGKDPRMYADSTMLYLIGLKGDVTPEQIFQHWYEHIDPEAFSHVMDSVNKMSSGEYTEVQYPWNHPNGKTLISRCGGVRNMSYTAGIRIEGTHQDVTETLKFNEEQGKILREMTDRHRHLKAFGDLINAALWRIDVNRNFEIVSVTWSDEVRKMLGFKDETDYPNEMQSFINILHPDDHDRVLKSIKAGFRSKNEGKVYDATFRMRRKTGEYVWYHAVGRLENIDREVRNLYGIVRDFSSHIELEKQKKKLAEALDMAQSANQAKTLFLNSMSHDIRTPLNAILGYTMMAKKNIEERDKVTEYLNKIGHAGNNLFELVNQILDMSRIESGSIKLFEEPVDIIEKMHEMAEIFNPTVHAKDITFITVDNSIKDRKIYADVGRTNQLIMNIIGNAVKYTPPGGVIKYEISQIASRKAGYSTYVFTVEDNGIGMSKNFLDQIFEPFSRENSSTVSKIQGTGLGMAIVKRLTELLGGKIKIESEQGKGTKMSVTLSFRLQEKADVQDVDKENVLDISILEGKRVLLVEDNEMNREITTMILEEHGIIVDTANDGDVAVRIIQDVADRCDWDYYDFVLMDIQMPTMNGYEAAIAIRNVSAPDGHHVPIIAMTANVFEEDRKLAFEAGMDEHIAKPIDIDKLFSAMAKFA